MTGVQTCALPISEKRPKTLTIIPGRKKEEDKDVIPSYTELLQLEDKIRDLRLKGIPGIERANVQFEESTGEYYLSTIGSNLARISDIEIIDRSRTYTNNVTEIYQYLGIEAARQAIVNELSLTLDGAGLEVDVHFLPTEQALRANNRANTKNNLFIVAPFVFILIRQRFCVVFFFCLTTRT